MRIDGEWHLGDDGVVRPIIRGEILTGTGMWQAAEFLVDTGADRTVFSAPVLTALRLQAAVSPHHLSGVGGIAEAVFVETRIRLSREGGGKVTFRGQYAAVAEFEALDICVLGRDITRLFAVIVDQPGEIICLLREGHKYTISQGQ
jgi:hypothetical protein